MSRPDFHVRTPAYPTPGDTLQRPDGLINRGPSPNFELVCKLFDLIRDTPKRKEEVLKNFIALWRKNVGPDVYPFMRLLLPDRDRDRPIYGLKEAGIARLYIDVLGLDRHSDAAQRMMKWKQPRLGEHSAGDFPNICYEAIASRKSASERNDLTVDAINGLLDQLSRGKAMAQYQPIFKQFMHHCTAEQQRWLIRIILKDLRISVREKTVLSHFHPDAIELFNVSSDLKRVCWTLADPNYRLPRQEAEITLFRSFLPQLCRRTASHDLGTIVKHMKTKPFLIEEKLDGERIQLHKRGKEYFYCSRKAKDYGYLYGTSPDEGTLTPYIDSAFKDGVDSCILDGEMLVWDPLLEKYLAFGTLKTAALDTSNSADAPRPCFKVFDVLMVNGVCLTDKPLSERRRVLYDNKGNTGYRVFEPVQGRFEVADQWAGETEKDIRDRLEWIMENKGEGLVVKEKTSTYKTNGRDYDWCKVKPEYADEMGENVDVLVIGGWWGQGRRGGRISSLLCGLRDQHEDDGTLQRPTFTTFIKVGGGMSLADYRWIQEKHSMHWKPFDRKKPPSWMTVGPVGNDDKPDVYIEPENSFVIEVKASEYIRTEGNYGFPYCLRFPRCKYIRYDEASRPEQASQEGSQHEERKVWDMWSCMSVQDVTDIIEEVGGKRKYKDDGPKAVKKRRTVKTSRAARLASSFAGQQLDVDAKTDIFQGAMFYVIKGDTNFSKDRLEEMIATNGGDFCQRPKGDDHVIVISSSDKMPAAKSQIREGRDIIKPAWILESIKRGRMLPFIQELVLHAEADTKAGEHFHTALADIDEEEGANATVRPDDSETEDEDAPLKSKKTLQKTVSLGDGWDVGVTQKPPDDESTEQSEGEGAADRASRSSSHLDPGDYGEDLAQKAAIDDSATESEGEISTSTATLTQSQGKTKTTADRTPASTDNRKPPPNASMQDDSATEDEAEQAKAAVKASGKSASPQSRSRSPATAGSSKQANKDEEEAYKMGDDKEQAYDDEKIFKNMVFYIDSAENAERNGLTANKKPTPDVEEELARVAKLITANGGRIVDDPSYAKLGHIVMHEAAQGRYKELVRKYGRPLKKHFVVPAWIDDSLDAGSPLNEDAYKP